MRVDRGFRGGDMRHIRQPAAVVIVAMTQDDGVHSSQIEAELSRISEQRVSLARVEKHTVRSKIKPYRQSVLCEEAGL
jgi:hypothetical protein